MPDRRTVSTHYSHDTLLDCIEAGMEEMGLSRDTVSIENLSPVDEFHIGGRIATERLLNAITLVESDHVLDVGCGLGGASRFAAQRFNCQVTGIDLTEEYINAGCELGHWLGLEQRVRLEQGDATTTRFPDDEFDKAYMLHVGMNIADKIALFGEIGRVLRPGSIFGIYDIMQVAPGEITYPVSWASTAKGSALGSPDEYRRALLEAGFKIVSERNRRDFALEFFATMQSKNASAGGPPPLGLQIVMGDDAPTKYGNMIHGVTQDRIAPIEIIAELAK